MYPKEFNVKDFLITPYTQKHDYEYILLMAEQWHILHPEQCRFVSEAQEHSYRKQFDGFCKFIMEHVEKDLSEGVYRDYRIMKNTEFCGIVDVGTRYFDNPEIGIILKETFRGCGLGYKIMSAFIQSVKTSFQCDKVIWRSESDNERAIALAKKLGGKYWQKAEGFSVFLI